MGMLDIQRNMLRGVAEPFSKSIHERVFGFEPTTFRGKGRRINRFMLGADPEFMLERGGDQIPAASLGLKPALAFGADQNDRLVELRPAASRSALAVTASTLAELRWMYRIVSATRSYVWRSGAFAHGDGMGGHVHFGRKRPTRSDEVAGLDGLAKTIRRTELLPVKEWTRRVQGDQFNQRYGQYGDIRLQKHGYEYRTLPSWLDSPKLAFMILTLSKLVVVDPEVTSAWTEKTSEPAWNLLRGLAKYYRGRDDDAWMLFGMMEKEEEWAYQGGDFRSRWGLTTTPTQTLDSLVYPDCIPATQEDIQDLHELFVNGKPLELRESEPHFRSSVPDGYSWLLPKMKCNRRPGVGELLHDVVLHKDHHVIFHFDSEMLQVQVPSSYKATKELQARFPNLEVRTAAGMFAVSVPRSWRTGVLLGYSREVLFSGLLPVYSVKGVTESSHKEFVDRFMDASKEGGSLGVVARTLEYIRRISPSVREFPDEYIMEQSFWSPMLQEQEAAMLQEEMLPPPPSSPPVAPRQRMANGIPWFTRPPEAVDPEPVDVWATSAPVWEEDYDNVSFTE